MFKKNIITFAAHAMYATNNIVYTPYKSNPFITKPSIPNPIFVVVPVKFDVRVGMNIAGIHYRIHSIGIEALLHRKALGGAYTNSQNVKTVISSTYSLNISIVHKTFLIFFGNFF